jgi:uncharacterized alkaline shock family protein YloU
MTSKLENEYGTIVIENDIIANTAGMAAMECAGIVGMAAKNVKDGFVQLLKRESLSRGVRLNTVDDVVSVDLHIIVEYGTNIPAIAESLMSIVKYRVEEFTGIVVGIVNIFIEGVRIDF